MIIFAIPFITGSYAYNGEICYISETGYESLWLYFLFYIPFYSFSLIILIIFISIYVSCRKNEKNPFKTIVIKRGYIYPFSVLLIVLPTSISNSIEQFYKSPMYNDIAVFTLVVLSSHGIINAIALVLNETVRKKLFNKPKNSELLISFEEYSLSDIIK